ERRRERREDHAGRPGAIPDEDRAGDEHRPGHRAVRERTMKKSQRRSGLSGTAGGGEAGVTLVQAPVAIAVLAFGMIALTTLLVAASSSNRAGTSGTATASVASETLEKLQALDFFFICPQAGAPQPVQQCPSGGSLTADVGPANNTAEVRVGNALTFHS